MRERRRLHLTGFGVIEAETVDEFHEWKQVRLLADAMTFAQQRQVETTLLIVLSPGDSIASLVGPDKLGRPLPVLSDRQPNSPCIKDDVWSSGSMTSFLQLFLDRFEVENPSDPLRMAVYRQLEISRLSTPFVELHHFLAFSALELLARESASSWEHRNSAVPITEYLSGLGFQIAQREVEEWCIARNEAFHRGRLVVPATATRPEIRLTKQVHAISELVCVVILRCMGFDDGHVSWDRWRTRMSK